MQVRRVRLGAVAGSLAVLLALSACDHGQPGPAEQAGKALDNIAHAAATVSRQTSDISKTATSRLAEEAQAAADSAQDAAQPAQATAAALAADAADKTADALREAAQRLRAGQNSAP